MKVWENCHRKAKRNGKDVDNHSISKDEDNDCREKGTTITGHLKGRGVKEMETSLVRTNHWSKKRTDWNKIRV